MTTEREQQIHAKAMEAYEQVAEARPGAVRGVIAAVRPLIEADALRMAADDCGDSPEALWLLERANRIERGEVA